MTAELLRFLARTAAVAALFIGAWLLLNHFALEDFMSNRLGIGLGLMLLPAVRLVRIFLGNRAMVGKQAPSALGMVIVGVIVLTVYWAPIVAHSPEVAALSDLSRLLLLSVLPLFLLIAGMMVLWSYRD